MTETPLTVNPDHLRAAANRVERSANALSKFRPPELREAELPGSDLLTLPGRVGGAFDDVIELMTGWANLARLAADHFERGERESAARLSE